MNQPRVTIGRIIAPHGVRGDLRVAVLTDFPDRFLQLDTICLEDGRRYPVDLARFHKKFVLLKLTGIDSMDEAEALRGKLLQVDREDAVVLPAGHYYFFDIIGLEVFDRQGQLLGKVSEILETGSNDVYVVTDQNAKTLLIPALKSVVCEIDVPGGRMVVQLQEEWDDHAH